MNSFKLSFAQINLLNEHIAEVIVNEGIELNMSMVEEYHAFLLSHLKPPFSLLINKINAYTYTFEAQKNIANLTEIQALAVISYNKVTSITTRQLASFPRNTRWNLQIFSDKTDALNWLKTEQELLQGKTN